MVVLRENIEKKKEYKEKTGDSVIFIDFKCDCGVIHTAMLKNFKSGHTTMCPKCTRKAQGHRVGKSNSKKNIWIANGDVAYTTLKNGIVIIDTEDIEKVEKYCWRIDKTSQRVIANSKDCTNNIIWLSRVIMGVNGEDARYILVDHKNGDILDNRKKNLRLCDKRENNINIKRKANNKSGFTGVYWSERFKKWVAKIYKKGHKGIVKKFSSFEDAVEFRGDMDLQLYGKFSGLYRRKDEMDLYLKIKKKKEVQ